ncbi:MAG: redox-sensitive transcriptional activator SoxR [Betaproteobacteria bacterium]|jgi:MerR family redox-sensitive transcriptional activator SoxR
MSARAVLLTIAELSARSGVAPSALRYYESLGLLGAVRTAGNQRRYARSALRRVAVIRAARSMGVPLTQIAAAFAALPDGREPTAADWDRMSRRWHADLSHRVAVLTRLRDDLGACIGCGCLSLQRCRLLNPGDRAASLGDGPRYLLNWPASGANRRRSSAG